MGGNSRSRGRRFTFAQKALFPDMPKLYVFRTSLLNFGAEFNQQDLDAHFDRRWVSPVFCAALVQTAAHALSFPLRSKDG